MGVIWIQNIFTHTSVNWNTALNARKSTAALAKCGKFKADVETKKTATVQKWRNTKHQSVHVDTKNGNL